MFYNQDLDWSDPEYGLRYYNDFYVLSERGSIYIEYGISNPINTDAEIVPNNFNFSIISTKETKIPDQEYIERMTKIRY